MSALEEMQKATLTANSEGGTSQSTIKSSFDALDNISLGFWENNLVGMNTDETTINTMISGINNYIQSVQDHINLMTNYEDKAIEAFGPSVGHTANQFVESMKKSCLAIISQLNRFKDDIKSVAAAYRAKGQSVVSAVNTQAENIKTTASSNTYEYSNGSN